MALRNLVRASGRFVRPVIARGYAAEAASAEAVNFTFTGPAGTFYNNEHVSQINVPSADGEFGVLPNHVPVIATLKPGIVSVTESSGNVKSYFVSSGVVTVNSDSSTQLIAEEAMTVDMIDASAARRLLDEFTSKLSSAADDVARAEAEIAVEVYSAMLKAVEN